MYNVNNGEFSIAFNQIAKYQEQGVMNDCQNDHNDRQEKINFFQKIPYPNGFNWNF